MDKIGLPSNRREPPNMRLGYTAPLGSVDTVTAFFALQTWEEDYQLFGEIPYTVIIQLVYQNPISTTLLATENSRDCETIF
ncbi:hypothetical protein KA001_02545 [Patescibacteria group bacterium]|nr:hypothetical protein [Patescibacteria group bacterium]